MRDLDEDQEDLKTEEVSVYFDEQAMPAVLVPAEPPADADAGYWRAMRRIAVLAAFGACGLIAYAWLVTEYAG